MKKLASLILLGIITASVSSCSDKSQENFNNDMKQLFDFD